MADTLPGLVVASLVALGACGRHEPAPRAPVPAADPGAAVDPINRLDAARLRGISARVLTELISALPSTPRARVARVTVVGDNALGEVNAYATCVDGAPIIAISDGLLLVAAHLAMSAATDERFETTQVDDYLAWLSAHGIEPPPPGFYVPAYHIDRGKLVRQRVIFEEQLAFVLGHELAHHYRGHLACSSTGGVVEALERIASEEVPLFSQTAELVADAAAVKNLLSAGDQRAGAAWTEDGALLVISAFHHRHRTTANDLVFAFERSHPLPFVRAPAILVTSELWRTSGGLLPP